MAYGNMGRAHAQCLGTLAGRAVQVQQWLPRRAAQHLHIQQAKPVAEARAKRLDGCLFGGKPTCNVGNGTLRQVFLLLFSEDFLQ